MGAIVPAGGASIGGGGRPATGGGDSAGGGNMPPIEGGGSITGVGPACRHWTTDSCQQPVTVIDLRLSF